MRSGSEYVGRTAGEEKEDSKETIGFVAEDSKGGQRSFWHTTFRGKSSVLYLYPKAGSKTAACAQLKHRLLSLYCGEKRSLP